MHQEHPLRAANRAARNHGSKAMRIIQSKKVWYNGKMLFLQEGGVRPSEEQLRLTILFYRNAGEIYARFEEWKDIDKLYFIPLYIEMTYSCGRVAEIAPDLV